MLVCKCVCVERDRVWISHSHENEMSQRHMWSVRMRWAEDALIGARTAVLFTVFPVFVASLVRRFRLAVTSKGNPDSSESPLDREIAAFSTGQALFIGCCWKTATIFFFFKLLFIYRPSCTGFPRGTLVSWKQKQYSLSVSIFSLSNSGKVRYSWVENWSLGIMIFLLPATVTRSRSWCVKMVNFVL